MSRSRITRRAALTGLGAASLAACTTLSARSARTDAMMRVVLPVAGGDVPAAGLVVRRQGKVVFAHAAGLAQGAGGEGASLAFTTATKMRVASVSKLATALTAHRLVAEGRVDLDTDVSAAFSRGLRHPHFPETSITLRHLLGHTGGLEDPETYWVAAPGRIETLFVPEMWRDPALGPPGAGFRYSNFGFGLIATVLEAVTGERFDVLARRLVFAPLGSSAGFNWSGVPQAERVNGATLYRKESDGWRIEADGPDVLFGIRPSILTDAGYDLALYRPGTNGTLFSPQGGLRASLDDLCVLVRAAASVPALTTPVWRHDPATRNGDTEQGYFSAFSAGAHLHMANDSPLPGFDLIGHHGEAYGLYCGAWHVPALDAEVSYAVTGTPDGETPRASLHPATNIYTAELWKAAASILAA